MGLDEGRVGAGVLPLTVMNGQVSPESARERGLVRALRPTQFAVIGVVCGAVQLGLLAAFTEGTSLGSLSNMVAFAISAQLNFVLNRAVTWRDRMGRRLRAVLGQLAGFNALMLVAVVFNQAIYLVALHIVPYLVAGAIGIGATTLGKYVIADRWIFRARKHDSRPTVPAATLPGSGH